VADIKLLTMGQQAILGRGINFNDVQLDASGEKLAWVFCVPETATVTHAGFRYGARTGTPPTYRIGLQTLDGTGLPSGTFLGGGTPASATFTPPADATWDGTWRWVALDNSVAVTRGDLVCVVVGYSSGTADGSNRSSFTQDAAQRSADGIPYSLFHDGGSWTKGTTGGVVTAVKSASKTYGFPWEAATNNAVFSTGERLALKFTLPAGSGDTLTCVGARFAGRVSGSGNWTFGLWDAAGSVIQSVQRDGDHCSSPGASQCNFEVYFDESSLTALSFGTPYYLGVQNDGVTVGLLSVDVDSSAEMTAFPGGADFLLSTWNGSAWSDSAASRPVVEPVLADITEPVGGGTTVITSVRRGGTIMKM
jgi:hypothetical protein